MLTMSWECVYVLTKSIVLARKKQPYVVCNYVNFHVKIDAKKIYYQIIIILSDIQSNISYL